MRRWMLLMTIFCVSMLATLQLQAAPEVPTSLAILPFQERGVEVKSLGSKISDLLLAKLSLNEQFVLVDREDLKKTLEEQELNLSGLVDANQAIKVGQLTGARLILTGSVFQVDNTIHLVGKVFSSETGRVFAVTVNANVAEKINNLTDQLGDQLVKELSKREKEMLPKLVESKDRLETAKQKFPKGKKPIVWIDIPERHIGQPTIDPAAATEIALWCKELGFEVLDPKVASRNQADVLLTGEGFSAASGTQNRLQIVKARLEIKATDRLTGKVVAIDRDTVLVIDLNDQIAGKTGLQKAAVNIAERLLPKLVTK